MSDEHSPLPWQTAYDIQTDTMLLGSAFPSGVQRIGRISDGNDAALIVRAVNAHAALVEALKRASVWVKYQIPNRMWSEAITQDERAKDVAMIEAALVLAIGAAQGIAGSSASSGNISSVVRAVETE